MNNLTPQQSKVAQENMLVAFLRMSARTETQCNTKSNGVRVMLPDAKCYWELVAWFDGIETRYGWEIVGGDAHHRHEKNWATAEQAAAALILAIVKRRLGEELLKGP